jgi:hypothetical protein
LSFPVLFFQGIYAFLAFKIASLLASGTGEGVGINKVSTALNLLFNL